MSNLFEDNGAEFSPDRKYRYCLWRIWDESKPLVMFIGLNPSTANEDSDDPTIRRVKSFAVKWGFGGVVMMNLFAFATAYPSELKKCSDPLGDNDLYLQEIGAICKKIIFAWGNFPEAIERGNQVAKMFPEGQALILNGNGSPRHPLYVKGDVVPVKFINANQL
jgi:hypothetical protein